MDILKLTADGDALFRYMDENAKTNCAIGGRFDTQDKSQKHWARSRLRMRTKKQF